MLSPTSYQCRLWYVLHSKALVWLWYVAWYGGYCVAQFGMVLCSIVWCGAQWYAAMVWLWHVVRRWYCWVSTIWRRNRFWATAGRLSLLRVYISLTDASCVGNSPPYHASMPYGIMLSHAIRLMPFWSLWLLIVCAGWTVHNVLWSHHDFSKRDHQNVICSKRPLQELRNSQGACSFQIQYLSSSTKITTNTEMAMLSKGYLMIWVHQHISCIET